MTLANPSKVIQAIVARLAAAVIPVGLALAGDVMFEEVRPFDITNMPEALDRLLLNSDRVAVVVLESVRSELVVSGTTVVTTVHYNFSVMFTDRNLANRMDAMLGALENPGTLSLIPSIITTLVGDFYDGPVLVTNGDGRMMALSDTFGDQHYDKICFRIPFTMNAGNHRVAFGRGKQAR